MKRLIILLALSSAFVACQTTMPGAATPSTSSEAKFAVAPDTAQRAVQLPKTIVDYDRSLLSAREKQVVAKLVEASKFIDEIYWLQVSEQSPSIRARLARQAASSDLDRAGYDYFIANKGRWDRLAKDEPFIEPFGVGGAKPPGAGFYPADLKKDEFERYVEAHADQKDALQGLLTVVRRKDDQLIAIPYSRYYRDLLMPAGEKLRPVR